jgi:hypothetical protein
MGWTVAGCIISVEYQPMPTDDASTAEYADELEIVLSLVCSDCKARYDAADDIRKDEEGEAPWGAWARRHATACKQAGWFLRSSSSKADVPNHLCPACAKRRGLVIHPSH